MYKLVWNIDIQCPFGNAHISGLSSCAPNLLTLLLLCCDIESAVTACWFLISCHVKPKTSFRSTVLQLECERRAWQGGNWNMNYRLLKLIWKPGNVLIHRLVICRCYSTETVVWHSGLLLTRINTAGAAVFVRTFGIHRTGESFKVFNLLRGKLNIYTHVFLIVVTKKINHM